MPYKTGDTQLSLKQRPLAKPTGAFRVVYSGQVGTINEIVIDVAQGIGMHDEHGP